MLNTAAITVTIFFKCVSIRIEGTNNISLQWFMLIANVTEVRITLEMDLWA